MITDDSTPNQLPQVADRCYPFDDTAAEARICEFTARAGSMLGLANLLFLNYNQLVRALRDMGWNVNLPVHIEGPAGTTWAGTIQKGKERFRMVVHSYQGEALVINIGPDKDPD